MHALTALRAQLAAILPPPPAVEQTIATGMPVLDHALPHGGIPCGRLTEIVGALGSGATSMVRSVVREALAQHRWVAYIDGGRTLAPADWAELASTGRLWMIRPPHDNRSTWCADILLRSGAFGLVVLDTADPIARAVAVRLTRLARDTQTTLVALRHDGLPAILGSALRIVLTRHQRPLPARTRGVPNDLLMSYASTLTATIVRGSGGAPATVEVHCATDLPRRLRADSEVPDRRGVAKRNRRGELAAPDAPGVRRTTATPDRPGSTAGGATLPKKRRFGEPAIGRDAFLLPKHPTLGQHPDHSDGGVPRPLGDRSGRSRKNPRRNDGQRGTLAMRRAARAPVG